MRKVIQVKRIMFQAHTNPIVNSSTKYLYILYPKRKAKILMPKVNYEALSCMTK